MSLSIRESILGHIHAAGSYSKAEFSRPRVILWTDEDRLWSQCLGALRVGVPTLWSLGDLAPENEIGPAAWLRYRLAKHDGDAVPVIYLPGIGRAAFRNADQCPERARHLFALQFQGEFWTQRNGKDWTPFAFLSSADGLGLDSASDQATKQAIQECLVALLAEDIDDVRRSRLSDTTVRAFVTKDPIQTLLRWMGQPQKTRQSLESTESGWSNFRAICQATYRFDPETDGTITAAERISSQKVPWSSVWARYCEAPDTFPGILEALELVPQKSLFEPTAEYNPGANRQYEVELETALRALSSVTAKDAASRVKELAADHRERAGWPWAKLGKSPLARAIVHLDALVDIIEATGNPTAWAALADFYSTQGWKADRAVWRALDVASGTGANNAVTVAIRAVYLPWLEKLAILTQDLSASYPVTGPTTCRTLPVEEGTVYLFADGLRMDLARTLEEQLRVTHPLFDITFDTGWAALPTVTATAKPAWMPLAARLGGPLEDAGFQAKEKASSNSLAQPRFKQLLDELGISFLEPNEQRLATGCGWMECGSVDSHGHSDGARLAKRIDTEIEDLRLRIVELLQSGWARVRVVTDHGWLLVPGGLPRTDLPKHLTASRWSRCAMEQPGAQHGFKMTPWFWDGAEGVVLATGVSCFVAGMEYAHGGLTLQEALIPSLTISASPSAGTAGVNLTEHKWNQLRLNVVFDGAEGLTIDLRKTVGVAESTILENPVRGAPDGQRNSLYVMDDAQGSSAYLVVLDKSGQCIFKQILVVGGS